MTAMQARELIAGQWRDIEGDAIRSHNPARPDETVWQGAPPSDAVDEAVEAAQNALPRWAAWSMDDRAAVLRRFQAIANERKDEMTALLRTEVGKPTWESSAEAGAIGAKVEILLEEAPDAALNRVRGFEVPVGPSKSGRCWFRPHGVMAVVGPFNFPAHLPNGHIAPALLLGNTIVFKPSDKAPACGQLLAEMFQQALDEANAPTGVLNLVHGAVPQSQALTAHEAIDGILFTGSWPVGRAILEANLDRPGRIVALEMGGNNPAIVMPDADLRQAAIEIARCAFNTAGQRCTSTRRLIAHEAIADRLIDAIKRTGESLVVDDPALNDDAFMGPLITAHARSDALGAQQAAIDAGGEAILHCEAIERGAGGHFISPGVMRVDRFTSHEDGSPGEDQEVFAPFLRYTTVNSLDSAITQANATRFGLAASIFSQDNHAIERFLAEARAGCVNVNTGTAGASSKLPFGGLGISGNHRPAGAFSPDYCGYPIASMRETADAATIATGMAFDDAWIN